MKKVEMICTGETSDIGNFKEGQVIPLHDELAEEAVNQNIAKYIDKPIKKKSEVKPDGRE